MRDPIRHLDRSAVICKFQKFPDIILVGTHLDVFDESGKTRINQMNAILAEIETEINDDKKIIVAGDFNSLRRADYNNSEWNAIVAIDKKRDVKSIEDVVTVLEKQKFVESFDACDVSIKVSVWANRRVDYIYGKNIEFAQSGVLKSTASDHYPIYCDIEI